MRYNYPDSVNATILLVSYMQTSSLILNYIWWDAYNSPSKLCNSN